MTMNIARWLSSLTIFTTVVGCTPSKATVSFPKVTNGIETNEYPGVVVIDSNESHCTGSFIASNVILTAAHCISLTDGSSRDFYKPVKVPSLNIESVKIVVHPLYSAGDNGHDLAWVHFASDVAPEIYKVSKNPPKVGDDVTLVGFGDNQYEDVNENKSSGRGTKRAGKNTVAAIQDGYIFLEGTPMASTNAGAAPTGVESASGSGDSGGPLFNEQGEIIGVTSSGLYDFEKKKKLSFYVDLSTKDSQDVLNQDPYETPKDNEVAIDGSYMNICDLDKDFEEPLYYRNVYIFKGNKLTLTRWEYGADSLCSDASKVATLVLNTLFVAFEDQGQIKIDVVKDTLLIEAHTDEIVAEYKELCPALENGKMVFCRSLNEREYSTLKIEGDNLFYSEADESLDGSSPQNRSSKMPEKPLKKMN